MNAVNGCPHLHTTNSFPYDDILDDSVSTKSAFHSYYLFHNGCNVSIDWMYCCLLASILDRYYGDY